jgi:hypothetical protein
MFARTPESTPKPRPYKQGTRLYCQKCGSEIEILTPCTGASPGQIFQCCGQDMTRQIGGSSHLESEA